MDSSWQDFVKGCFSFLFYLSMKNHLTIMISDKSSFETELEEIKFKMLYFVIYKSICSSGNDKSFNFSETFIYA